MKGAMRVFLLLILLINGANSYSQCNRKKVCGLLVKEVQEKWQRDSCGSTYRKLTAEHFVNYECLYGLSSSDIECLLGRPNSFGYTEDRGKAYDYILGGVFDKTSKQCSTELIHRVLSITVDSNDKVKYYKISEE